ncbi:conserved hypothetical protein [metagenome]|uniref:DNA-binding protein n=1 Tax=metagenome TaxID=256318 RepID=A0A2P2C8P0_9ZZZZ
MSKNNLSVATPETATFWEGCAVEELRLQWCGRCEAHYHYPRPACPTCGLDDQVIWRVASGRGTLHSYVINYLPTPGFEPGVPIVIALVELDEGPRMMTNIVGVDPDPEQLELDMPVVVNFVQRGEGHVPVFSPADRSTSK